MLGVRFDVVDSYAWHGTVDEISKVFAPLAMLELLRSSLRPPFRLRPMGLESESSFV